MTKEEYGNKMLELTTEFETAKKMVRKEYAFSNNPHKVGDIISDHIGKLKIESISVGVSFGNTYPECVYNGIELKKDDTPAKKQIHTLVWQSNLVPFN